MEKFYLSACGIMIAASLYGIGYAADSYVPIKTMIDTVTPAVCESVTEPTIPETTVPETEPVEYEVADIIWRFLKNNDFSDACAAGIMGNIMAECGGCSFNLYPEIYGQGFYGICQWSSYYFPQVQGQNLEYQLSFLLSTVKSQFGSHYEKFMEIEDPATAAKSFAIWYERCAEWTYEVRMSNAVRAYDYFVGRR